MAAVTICSDFGALPANKKALTYSLLLDWVVKFLTSASLGSCLPQGHKEPISRAASPTVTATLRRVTSLDTPFTMCFSICSVPGEGALLCGGEQLTLEKSTPAFLSSQTFGFPLPHHIGKVLTYSCPANCAMEKERERLCCGLQEGSWC